MLEQTRRRGASIVIYLIFGLLIVVFAVSFGPASFGQGQGCGGAASGPQVTIDGTEYDMNTWRWALNNTRGDAYPARARYALDGLIRRELLALEAERRGLRVSNATVDDKLLAGRFWILSYPQDGKRIFFDGGEFFDYRMLMQNVVRRTGLSIGAFKAEQRREVLAAMMERILASGARVSRDEVLALWAHGERTVTFDAVAFELASFRDRLMPSEADVAGFLAEHEDRVKARYEEERPRQYTATVPRLRLRRVAVDAADRAKLVRARAEVVAGRRSLAQVARDLDRDPAVRARGGDLGWRLPDGPGLPDPALDAALAALEPGGPISEPVDVADGTWLLQVEARREGDLAYDEVKHEIAEAIARDEWAREAARRAAQTALAEAQRSGKPLAELYEVAPPPARQTPVGPGAPQIPPEMLREVLEMFEKQLERPDLTDEERQNLERQLEELRAGGLGRWTWESPDVAAAWAGDGEADAAPVAVPAAPPAPPLPDPMAPPIGTLPALGAIEPPRVQRIGPMPRDRERIPDLGIGPALIAALFDELPEGPLAERVFAVESPAAGDGDVRAYVLIQLTARTQPDLADFEGQAELLLRAEQADRGRAIVSAWLRDRCNDLVGRRKIEIANEVLVYQDDAGQRVRFQYGACSNL
jgi:peptidyl-prolyl cis-trans isomerase D